MPQRHPRLRSREAGIAHDAHAIRLEATFQMEAPNTSTHQYIPDVLNRKTVVDSFQADFVNDDADSGATVADRDSHDEFTGLAHLHASCADEICSSRHGAGPSRQIDIR